MKSYSWAKARAWKRFPCCLVPVYILVSIGTFVLLGHLTFAPVPAPAPAAPAPASVAPAPAAPVAAPGACPSAVTVNLTYIKTRIINNVDKYSHRQHHRASHVAQLAPIQVDDWLRCWSKKVCRLQQEGQRSHQQWGHHPVQQRSNP